MQLMHNDRWHDGGCTVERRSRRLDTPHQRRSWAAIVHHSAVITDMQAPLVFSKRVLKVQERSVLSPIRC
jgi:hypothetical protein